MKNSIPAVIIYPLNYPYCTALHKRWQDLTMDGKSRRLCFMKATSSTLRVDPKLLVGIDVGGTKTLIADTRGTAVHRYNTPDFASMDAILETYFAKVAARPKRIVVVMAGPRNDDTGTISMTNCDWPPFDPSAAAERYPGTTFTTANDMIGATAGVMQLSSIDTATLKPGTPTRTGTKVVVTMSTGIGVAAAVWSEQLQRYIFVATQGGHLTFQPRNEHEQKYLHHLHKKYPQASSELALAGKHGIDNLVDHFLDEAQAPKLARAIVTARKMDNPVGAVLLEFATEGTGANQKAAHNILHHMGALVGGYLGDLGVAFCATGGIYLMGSVSIGLSEYWAEHTPFAERFAKPGGSQADWLQHVPIYLTTNPHIGVEGALALAKEE
jgi:glucokinase